ncbi:MAG: decaprenyl-phosphate phosphoribosyltransferase [Acidobacteria bacterium]|nr:decaprenyl-phosphate phosphoribosyltransferase [Acidobacteriota bacterium]MBU4306334.1 decaprenyl-phosphate phosphoribosyltransferase [Acidobacteriota bacterium]MBU4405591.1 decaprenyl-phosphate phosphoribosyltransferase [Acidobacteriota bacterium]MCG2810771.1 decaprenyl-phosphate phosphoribosyltransferase [Candidatus Aminicenantes bacterium]
MTMLKNILISLRIKQWVKNIFIFAPMIFSLHMFQPAYIQRSLLAFFLFSLVTGGIYIFNDILDRGHDRLHPVKQNRPIASGRLSAPVAGLAAFALLAGVLLLIARFNREFFVIAVLYIGLNILYSLFLKSVVIIDTMVIALGFVLRIMIGGAVNHVVVYPWILITTFLLAIFLALIKRRQEFLKIQSLHPEQLTRKTLQSYNLGMLDQMISIATATTLISYIMYVLSLDVQQKFHTSKLYYTVPFVIFGIFRYLFLAYSKGEGESPTDIIYSDLPFTLNIILWVSVFILLVNH